MKSYRKILAATLVAVFTTGAEVRGWQIRGDDLFICAEETNRPNYDGGLNCGSQSTTGATHADVWTDARIKDELAKVRIVSQAVAQVPRKTMTLKLSVREIVEVPAKGLSYLVNPIATSEVDLAGVNEFGIEADIVRLGHPHQSRSARTICKIYGFDPESAKILKVRFGELGAKVQKEDDGPLQIWPVIPVSRAVISLLACAPAR